MADYAPLGDLNGLLASERSDREEILQWVIGKILQERRAICLSAGIHEHGVTVGR
jgi:hypothetical protein